jgi:alkanesulfonate monooxygenase SsuD/methylene tetrahydromethanopterin reductase-like flavin-dependent oxidoreductase (luciferase family)
VVLAHQLATLDQICEGRLVLGAGDRQRRSQHPR